MQYFSRIVDGVVVERIDLFDEYEVTKAYPADFVATLVSCDDTVKTGWTYENGVFSPPVSPPPTLEEQQAAFTAAVQTYLDSFARTRNYDGIMSAATYATSTVPKFKAEGQYAVEARDAVWAKGYEILDEVLSGQRPMPTIEEVIAELPPLAWPEV